MTWFVRRRAPDPWMHQLANLVTDRVLERVLPFVEGLPLTDEQETACAAILNAPGPTPPVSTVPAVEPESNRVLRFCLDSLFLEDSFHHLSMSALPPPGSTCRPRFKETLHYATGVYLPKERMAVPSQLIALEYAEQSSGGVVVDNESNIRALEFLNQRGLTLLTHIHTHPGSGASATTPSQIDLNFQSLLERGGHICIGGIFDRRGEYVRFYASDPERFSITIHGRGYTEVRPNVFKVSLAR